MKLLKVLTSMALLLPAVVRAQRLVGYYGKTAGECPDYPPFEPKDLPLDLYTNLNYAFALINDQGVIAPQSNKDFPLYKELNDLKKKKPSLRTAVTIGGWEMDMSHYSKMVSNAGNRQKFIKSAMAFVRQHGFDGLDFDWEYPSDKLRGGHDNDPQNFVTFMKEMRAAATAEPLQEGHERLILSIALPGGPFHGNYFLVTKLAEYVDWFNIMAYNLHGQWESMVFCAAPLNDPALNTDYYGYSLVDAVESMAPKTVNPKKFNLGLSLSGVTFTLKDKKKTATGSPAIGPGRKGCQEKGAMSYFESIKLANNLKSDAKDRAPDIFNRVVTQAPKMDELSKCMYMVVDYDQWVGFDTPETFAYKVEYLKDYGFGGVSIWSMDSDTSNHELTNSIHDSLHKGFMQQVIKDEKKDNSTVSKKVEAKAPVDDAKSQTNSTAPVKAIKGDDSSKAKQASSSSRFIHGDFFLLALAIVVVAIFIV